jgi:alpha-galactosidase
MSIDWSDISQSGKLIVRDVWRQRNIGRFTGSFKSRVGAHDVIFVRLVKS